MKKRRILISVLLLCLLISGCASPAPAQSRMKAEPAPSAAAEPARELPAESPAASAELSPFIGNWKLYAQEGDVISATHEELEEQAERLGVDPAVVMSATLRGDGTLSLCVYGMLAEGSWTDSGDGTGVFSVNGQDCGMRADGGFLRVDMKAYLCVFEPGEKSADELAAAIPAQPDPGAQMPEQKPGDPRLVGEWRFYDRDSADPALRIAHEELEKLLEQGRDYAGAYTLSIGDDGWFKATDFTGFERNNWTDNGDGTGTLTLNGESCRISAEDGFLLLSAPDSVTRYERTAELGSPMAKDEEDRKGVVVEKLEGDSFPDRYLVRAEDGALYECEYIGFEELEPGTEVTVSKWGRDWMAEPSSGWGPAPAETEPPLFTTAEGITLDDLSVQLAGGSVWSFSCTLTNPTGKDAEFDPSLFTLKHADGTELKTMAPYVSGDLLRAGTTYYRISITIGKADAVELGEEISFWYDGTFLRTVTAKEF